MNHQQGLFIQGSCHCGNVRLSISQLTPTAVSCNCSVCFRYAAIWGFFTEAEVSVEVGDKGLERYCHGDRMINFNRCGGCGSITHYTSTDPSPSSRLAVNYRMFKPEYLDEITVRHFDGADTWQFLD